VLPYIALSLNPWQLSSRLDSSDLQSSKLENNAIVILKRLSGNDLGTRKVDCEISEVIELLLQAFEKYLSFLSFTLP
jgi:hypothetical protein